VDPRRTGVGSYTRALLRHLPGADPETSYTAWYLAVRMLGSSPRRFTGWSSNLDERVTRLPAKIFGPVSLRTGVPKLEWLAGRSDLVFAPNFIPPPTGAPRLIVVVHDLAFEVMPETAPHHDARWRRRFGSALDRAAAVIVPSAATRADLTSLHDVDRERIHVIHHGTDAESFSPASPLEVEDVRRRWGIPGPYIVFVGGLEPRKNLEALVEAFGMLDETRCHLVLVGGSVPWAKGYPERVDRAIAELPPGVARRVVRTGYVSGADRRALLSGAEVLAYPSLYEGFGFPILEGFASNVPVLTSDRSAMPETAGDAALLVDPSDPASIAEGFAELLGDDDLRNVLRAAGTARVASFTWERCARATAGVVQAQHEQLAT
jgi:glycosyltransferase involved in cell wall biosynthesis